MKKKTYGLIGVMAILVIATIIVVSIFSKNKGDIHESSNDDTINIVTSFYPIYIIGSNLGQDVDGLHVSSLVDFSTGCPHDYQLTTDDMKLLSDADIFIMNGGGMEGFLQDIIENYPDIYVIDSSSNINMLESQGHEGEVNAHIWLDTSRYIQQIDNIRNGIIKYIEESNLGSYWQKGIEKINHNRDNYVKDVKEIDEKIEKLLEGKENRKNKVVVFHDAFEYLADRLGIEVLATIEVEGHTALSASEIAEIIDLINDQNVTFLFTELQFGNSITKRIEEETQVKVYVIDSAVTGDGSMNSYIEAMERNLNVLKELMH